MTIRAQAITGSPLGELARSWWARIARLRRSDGRRLRLAETVALGERRFVAVLEFEHSRFLLGGTSSSLVLLARLHDRSGEDDRCGEKELFTSDAGRAESGKTDRS